MEQKKHEKIIRNKLKWNKNPKLEIFFENHSHTRHIKNKKIDFAPSNISIMANKLFSTNLERFIRRIKFS